jgi:hypothetical protein
MARSGSPDSMGPHIRYARVDDAPTARGDDALSLALDLARKIEELLEDTRTLAPPPSAPSEAPASQRHDPRAHSTRMARAMAASLVDELQTLVMPPRKTGSS